MPESSSPPRIAIVDDHQLFSASLAGLLTAELGAEIVYEGVDPLGPIRLDRVPDLVLLDLDLGPDAPRLTPASVSELQQAGCVVLVVSALAANDQVLAMVEAGVAGFVSKAETAETFAEAVRTVLAEGQWTSPEVAAILLSAANRPDLTEREQAVLVLYARGMKLDAVARRLGIKPGTASTYLRRARQKYSRLGRPVSNRVDLFREAQRDGLL